MKMTTVSQFNNSSSILDSIAKKTTTKRPLVQRNSMNLVGCSTTTPQQRLAQCNRQIDSLFNMMSSNQHRIEKQNPLTSKSNMDTEYTRDSVMARNKSAKPIKSHRKFMAFDQTNQSSYQNSQHTIQNREQGQKPTKSQERYA